MAKGLKIPFEVADGITLACLKNHHKYLKEETKAHLEKGQWLHPDDLANNIKFIHAMELLIPYFGGEV
jgi:hypothetical protein